MERVRRQCLVVGGGALAEREVRTLIGAGHRVTVVSPRLSPRLLGLARDGHLQWKPREYREGDIDGFSEVLLATPDEAVNARIAEEARARGLSVAAALRAPE